MSKTLTQGQIEHLLKDLSNDEMIAKWALGIVCKKNYVSLETIFTTKYD